MKKVFGVFALMLFLTGCATSAKVSQPTLKELNSNTWEDKTLDYEIFYAQPTPGIFSGGDVVELQPIEEIEKSIASSRVLHSLDEYIKLALPKQISLVDLEEADLEVKISIRAYNKRGPVYPDFQFLSSLTKSILTFGLISKEHNLVADFDLACSISDKEGNVLLEKSYKVDDVLKHQKSRFDFSTSEYTLSASLLKKHLVTSLSNFFAEFDSKNLVSVSK